MPAMHDNVLVALNAQLIAKRDIFLRTLPFEMTHMECLKLVAPSDHINVLVNAAKYSRVVSKHDYMALEVPAEIDGETDQRIYLLMRTHAEQTPPLVPRDPQWQPKQDGSKVIEWMRARYEIGRKFGAAQHVLYQLVRECDDGAQLRYMWPAIMHLCKVGVDAKMDRWIEKFSAYRPCRSTPAVTPAFKTMIQDSSALLTSMALIGEDIPERPLGFVDISLFSLPDFTGPEESMKTISRL